MKLNAWLALALINASLVAPLTIFDKKAGIPEIKGHERDSNEVLEALANNVPRVRDLKVHSAPNVATDIVVEMTLKSTLKGAANSHETTSPDFSSSPEPDWSTVIFTTPEFTADKPLETARKAPIFF